MMNPTVSSKKLAQSMLDYKQSIASNGAAGGGGGGFSGGDLEAARPENNLQDTWVWNGRPDWRQIFLQMKGQAVDPDVRAGSTIPCTWLY
jgi:hypothetical protein